MALKLVNLLRYKKSLMLLGENNKPILDDKGKPVLVWIRIIGDEDQQDAHKMARVKSAEKRALLRDESTSDFKDQILPFREASKEICIEVIKASKGNEFTAEALANVERPELPKMEEVAIDADAPTLEEQEKLDTLTKKVEQDYRKALEAYVLDKLAAYESELQAMDEEEVREVAVDETANALALAEFLTELEDEKAWRSVYTDEACKTRAVADIEEFRELHSVIKRQIKAAYSDLELSPDEVKN